MKDAHLAIESLNRGISRVDVSLAEMEKNVASHNRSMISDRSELHMLISSLQEQVDLMRAELAEYRKFFMSSVYEFKTLVHTEQIETLEKHIDGLGFEKALTREQVKEMIDRELS